MIDDAEYQKFATQIEGLFRPVNFQFMTRQEGRTPTYYFQEGGLNSFGRSGRLRTMHAKGPLIEITSIPKTHTFFNTRAERDRFRQLRRSPQATGGAASRTSPKNGDHHFEYTRLTVHPSGGTVALGPCPSADEIAAIIADIRGHKDGRIRNGDAALT